MERISIFNYEAFYLDFLEGNLSEEDTVLLLTFLEEHPELKIEEEPMIGLQQTEESIDASFKASLKQFDIGEETINKENIEYFMIAETEGLLSDQKLQELDSFVAHEEYLLKSRKIYAGVHLQPDKSIRYVDKQTLKRSKRIVLWPYISVAAAASVALIIYFGNPNAPITETHYTAHSDPRINNKIPTQNTHAATHDPSVNSQSESSSTFTGDDLNVNPKVTYTAVQEVSNTRAEIGTLSRKNVRLLRSLDDPELEEIDYSYTASDTESAKAVQTYYGFDDMKNPIKPITNRLGNAIKQEVDFRTAKKSPSRRGGFYLRVGNFEVSHRN